ncbi:type IV secretion system DotC family protein [Alphaproteobacteria bacterium]|nr:type IV secretion system DotC family protein [Alphaproteobacteria bacterium]
MKKTANTQNPSKNRLLMMGFICVALVVGFSGESCAQLLGGSSGAAASGGFTLPEDDNRVLVYNGNGVKDFLENDQHDSVNPPPPKSLSEIQNLEKENKSAEDSGLPFDIRKEAIREAAISFGARSGLAYRTFEIRNELAGRGRYLDKIYNFSNLLVPAPSGLLIEPPIINEAVNSMIIADGGQQAAVSDRIYNIVNNANIVSTSRTWRDYLLREWGDIAPPPDILRPENDEERELWNDLVSQGWEQGVLQANEIFEDDLNQLTADFRGMVRYRVLLAQGMISQPYALQVDRGITGGGNSMRVGDRAVQITGVPELITGSDQWQPANR